MKTYKMGKEERLRRGIAGREWVMSDESKCTASNMGQNFIENLDVLFDKWEPQPRYHLIKVDDSTILDNHNPNSISTTDEFKKEIASI